MLGLDFTIHAWARREGWGGRPINPAVAKGMLVATLGVLARHFGL